MTAEQTVALYYDARRNHRGDLSGVPLAEELPRSCVRPGPHSVTGALACAT